MDLFTQDIRNLQTDPVIAPVRVANAVNKNFLHLEYYKGEEEVSQGHVQKKTRCTQRVFFMYDSLFILQCFYHVPICINDIDLERGAPVKGMCCTGETRIVRTERHFHHVQDSIIDFTALN